MRPPWLPGSAVDPDQGKCKRAIKGDGPLYPGSPGLFLGDVFEKYSTSFLVDGKPVQINLWDTAGQEDYDRLRPLSYSGTHVILMCYDVTNPSSFDNIRTKWYPEVNHFCKGVPILLIGCKTDLRKDRMLVRKLHEDRLEPITYHKALAQQLHSVSYLECSARFQENITDIFMEASRAALSTMKKNQRRRKLKRGCLLS
uniref:Uncharacterized protein n=1 Tax=Sphenodon punctatus TaxID=8508 RepID=A0A8D0H0F0_SPHPU